MIRHPEPDTVYTGASLWHHKQSGLWSTTMSFRCSNQEVQEEQGGNKELRDFVHVQNRSTYEIKPCGWLQKLASCMCSFSSHLFCVEACTPSYRRPHLCLSLRGEYRSGWERGARVGSGRSVSCARTARTSWASWEPATNPPVSPGGRMQISCLLSSSSKKTVF